MGNTGGVGVVWSGKYFSDITGRVVLLGRTGRVVLVGSIGGVVLVG